ncbi:hypothetical protein HSB1_35680 [Halogranum salarium B-1]|uniref:Uncharacterized protein n=1 Tax=Halogranum salarium B-1 TaxID=1210908 RepID=J3JE87_9EURY|nr:hypothetical protein HSB1_35680 [Halogranum salarium B-1]
MASGVADRDEYQFFGQPANLDVTARVGRNGAPYSVSP